jgi:purine-binding chemotaxis protein CheW
MADGLSGAVPALIVAVDMRTCALPISSVIEAMRPLPIEPVSGTPPFVRGVSIIRGMPVPVVDMRILLGAEGGIASRFVALRLGERQVAISVDAVLGVRQLAPSMTRNLPPLLQGASHDAIEAIGTLDEQMLVVLRSGWQLPGEVFQAVSAWEESQ